MDYVLVSTIGTEKVEPVYARDLAVLYTKIRDLESWAKDNKIGFRNYEISYGEVAMNSSAPVEVVAPESE
jgi:hypothetical protein